MRTILAELNKTQGIWGSMVVGRDGIAYNPQQWESARVYRSGEQENLLIGDAATRGYLAANEQERKWLRLNAWGHSAP